MLKIAHPLLALGLILIVTPILSAADASFETLKASTFEEVWERVNEAYYDETFGGRNWAKLGERYRKKALSAETMAEFRRALGSLLYELGDSHLSLISSEFEKDAMTQPWKGGWAGAELRYAGSRLVFCCLDESGPAYRSGVRAGDMLLEVNGWKPRKMKRRLARSGVPRHTVSFEALYAAYSQFKGAPGAVVEVKVRSPRGRSRELAIELDAYEGERTAQLGNVGAMPLRLVTEVGEDGVAYLRFSLWFPAVMPRIREFVAGLPEGTEGLVIDLRGNAGGLMAMAGGLSGLLLDEQKTLGRTALREGHINVVGFPQRSAYLGKVAILVDEGSVSTSEVFAVGLQELGRARVFGRPTPGAALPSMIYNLPNGDLLQVATGDFKTPSGYSLEGNGVKPDEVIRISPIDLSEGNDRVLQSAKRWILNSDPS